MGKKVIIVGDVHGRTTITKDVIEESKPHTLDETIPLEITNTHILDVDNIIINEGKPKPKKFRGKRNKINDKIYNNKFGKLK